MDIDIKRDYLPLAFSFIIPLILQLISTVIFCNIQRIPFLKSIDKERNRLKVITNIFKILMEMICLILTIPSIIDIIKNFTNETVSEWNLESYRMLQWSLCLIMGIYLYEILTLRIRINTSRQLISDIAHWIHHMLHVLMVCYGYFYPATVTYYDLRLVSTYAFWTFIASVPLTYSITRYLTTDSAKEKYYLCLFNSYMFGLGNIIRCLSGLVIYVTQFNRLTFFPQISFIPAAVLWSIDQIFTSITLKKMSNKEFIKFQQQKEAQQENTHKVPNIPEEQYQSDDNIEKRTNINICNGSLSAEKNTKYVNRWRKSKLVMTVLIVGTSIFILCMQSTFNISIYKSMAVYVAVDYAFFIFVLLFVTSTAKHLHFVNAEMIGIHGYRVFAIPSSLTSNNNECIKSISELCAIPGSSTHFMFLTGCSMSYAINLFAVLVKISEWKYIINISVSTTQWISLYLFFVSNVGSLMIAVWNLEENAASRNIHFTGTVFHLLGFSVAFVLNQNLTPISIGMAIIQLITAVIYIVIIYKLPNQFENLKQVHKASYFCILSELIAVSVSFIIASLFIWCMHDDVIL